VLRKGLYRYHYATHLMKSEEYLLVAVSNFMVFRRRSLVSKKLQPNIDGKYNRQETYEWFLDNRIGGKPLWYTSEKLDYKLHRRLTKFLGAKFSTEQLFKFLQPGRSTCHRCGSELTTRNPNSEISFQGGFKAKYCGRSCAAGSPEVRQKIEESHLRIRGVIHVSLDKSVIEKRKQTNRKRYGGSSTFDSPSLSRKAHKTIEDRYGVRDFSQTQDWYEKVRQTCTQKYGVSWVTQLETCKEKTRSTFQERYEVDWFSQTPEWYQKCVATCQARYGVKWVTQDPEIFERQKNSYKRKSIRINGKLHRVQGYEPFVLKYLEPEITKLWTKSKNLPCLYYKHEDKSRRYYPDALVEMTSGERILFEVKSTYTASLDIDKNLQKFHSAIKWCRETGATFVLAIGHPKGKVDMYPLNSKIEVRRILTRLSGGRPW